MWPMCGYFGEGVREQFIGVYLHMGLMQTTGVLQYWAADTRYDKIAEVFSRNRFLKLKSCLHFVDNLSTPDSVKNSDKIWKIRPWLNSLREKFVIIDPEENHSIDEIIVPFRSRSSLKQYIRGKPNPWGFKLWGRAGASGFLYDFDIYQGKGSTNINNHGLGLGGNVVVSLIEPLPQGKGFNVYADNFFSSLRLVDTLTEKNVAYLGTIRSNRVDKCPLESE